jgi:hypothetical protein
MARVKKGQLIFKNPSPERSQRMERACPGLSGGWGEAIIKWPVMLLNGIEYPDKNRDDANEA